MSKIVEITDQNFEETTKKGIVLVDFWAPWCSPCRGMLPILEEISEEFSGIDFKICKIDIDENPESIKKFDVRSVPTFIVFKDGEKVTQVTGSRSKSEIIDLFREMF